MSDTTGSNRADIIARAGHAATLTLADLEVGQSFSIEHCFGSDEVDAFAALTGDYNPLHVDPDYAAGTEFGDRIVHGMLLASLFSTLASSFCLLPKRHPVRSAPFVWFWPIRGAVSPKP